jgi:SAM-dependent methyltransferase
VPDRALFELDNTPDWGYEDAPFLDNELRYTKMHRLLRERYRDLAGKRILDLGSSRGQLLERFKRYGAQLKGLEIDPDEIEHGRRRGIDAVREFINVFDGTRMVARLPFESGSYDVVLAGEIIEHIVDTEGFLREIFRVLAPGGATVVTTPNVLWWKHRFALLRGRYPDLLEHRVKYGDDFGHVRIFTPTLLRGLLEEVGFVEVEVIGKRLGPVASIARAPRPVARALDRLADRLPNISDQMIAFARKPA